MGMTNTMSCPRCGGPTRWVRDEDNSPAPCSACSAFYQECVDRESSLLEADPGEPDPNEELESLDGIEP